MLSFCPNDGNLLLVELAHDGPQFWCQTCNYCYQIDRKHSKKLPLKPKELDDVLSAQEQWRFASKTATRCKVCQSMEAWFMEVKCRSVDEPATIFYRCCGCAAMWKEA